MPYESEKITRKKRIDKQLKSAGWFVIPYHEGMDLSQLTNHAVEELPTKNGFEILNTGKLKKPNSLETRLSSYSRFDKIVINNLLESSEQVIVPIENAEIINLTMSPDNTHIAFELMGGKLYSMNIDGTNLVDLGKGNRPRWSFDSRKIIYMIAEDDGHTFKASDIYSINADGTQKKNLTNTDDFIELNPCFAPDGKSLVFDVYNDGSIYLMNIE